MSTPSEEPTIHELLTRLAELERAHARLQEELTHVRAERAPVAEEQTSTQTRNRPRRSSRRKVLEKGLGVAAATVGVGAMLELSGGTALAAGGIKPGVFASNVAGTPAVKATGTNGADGVDATSDSGTGIFAKSGSFNAIHAIGGGGFNSALFAEGGTGYGVYATGNVAIDGTSAGGIGVQGNSGTGVGVYGQSLGSGLAGLFDGNVHVNGNFAATGTLSSGAGALASSVSGTPAVKATGTNGADGVDASSDSGTGVSATSTSGPGLVATSSTGLAGHFVGGDVDMDKNLNVAGALSSSSGTFSSTGTAGHFVGNVAMDNNLKVAGALSTGTLSSGAGTLASSVVTTPAVQATGTNGAYGVFANSDSGISVYGTTNSGYGVFGQSASGIGVYGISSGSPKSGGFAGRFDGSVQVNGNFTATGTKSFVQAHPTDPSREIVYVALEGGEAGTYVRGTGTLVNGKAVLALPEHFGLVTATEGLTIHLTPRGEWLQLYVVELDTAQIVVREAQGKSGAFDYLVYGVRRGYEQHEVIRTKR